MTDRLDVGAVDIPSFYRKPLSIVAHGDSNEEWRLVVSCDRRRGQFRVVSFTLDGRDIALSSYSGVIAYIIMRAICRGMDKSDVSESDIGIVVDIGKLPPMFPETP